MSESAVKFLRVVRPQGPWTLTAIHPDQPGAPTRTFIGHSEINDMTEWIKEKNKTMNCYFTANPVRRRIDKRPRESDIKFYQYVALDFDPFDFETPEECQERVRKSLARACPQPTFVWNTGNGVQAMWKIRPPVELLSKEDIEDCKLINRKMAKDLKADLTVSLDHVYRIVGTWNYPNAVKRAKGRKKVLAQGFSYEKHAAYSADVFDRAKASSAPKAHGLVEPFGGWNTPDGISNAILLLETTKDVSRPGVSKTAIRTALRLRDYGVSTRKAFHLMWQYWVPRCDYDWGEDELRDKIKRAYESLAQNDPGCRTAEYISKFEGGGP